MIRFRTLLLLLAAAGLIVATTSAPGHAPASKAYRTGQSGRTVVT